MINPESTPTRPALIAPVHLNRSANLRASMYAPNAAPSINAMPGSATGMDMPVCVDTLTPKSLRENPEELVFRLNDPEMPSTRMETNTWKMFGVV